MYTSRQTKNDNLIRILQYDNNTDMIEICVNRYTDAGVDLSALTAGIITSINGTIDKILQIKGDNKLTTEFDDSSLVVKWIVGINTTVETGEVLFFLTFNDGKEKVWQDGPYSLRVSPSIDQNEIVVEYASFLTQWEDRMNQTNEQALESVKSATTQANRAKAEADRAETARGDVSSAKTEIKDMQETVAADKSAVEAAQKDVEKRQTEIDTAHEDVKTKTTAVLSAAERVESDKQAIEQAVTAFDETVTSAAQTIDNKEADALKSISDTGLIVTNAIKEATAESGTEINNATSTAIQLIAQQSQDITDTVNDAKTDITGMVSSAQEAATSAEQSAEEAKNYRDEAQEASKSAIITDGQITIEKLSRDIAPATSNLYDKTFAEDGKLMGNNPNNPVLQNYAAAISSGIVPIHGTGSYVISQGDTKIGTICFFDADQKALYAIGYNGNQYGTWALPDAEQVTRDNIDNYTRLTIIDNRVCYIWWYMSGANNYMIGHTTEQYQEIIDNAQLNFSDAPLPYESFGYYIDGSNVEGYDDVLQNVAYLNNDMEEVKKELFPDPEITVEGNALLTISGDVIQVRTRLDDSDDLAIRMNKTASSNGGLGYIAYTKMSRSAPYTDVTSTTGTIKGAGDDICPLKVDDLYIGGNHGWPVVATVTGTHDKTLADIGSRWKDAKNSEFVLVQVHENALKLIRSSGGVSQIFLPLVHDSGATNVADISTGTTTYAGQLLPSLYGFDVGVFVDGKQIVGDVVTAGKSVKIIEKYDVIDLVPTLAALSDSAGSNDNDSYISIARNNGYSTLTHTLVYDYNSAGGCAVTGMVNMHKDRSSLRLNCVQSASIGTSIMVPLTTTYQTPQQMPAAAVNITKDVWTSPDTPPAAYIQYNPIKQYITVLGYHNALDGSQTQRAEMDSVGQYSAQYKMYPYGVYRTSPVAGDTYTCIAYRCIGTYDNNVYIGQYAVNGTQYAIIVALDQVDAYVQLPFGDAGDVIDTVYTDGFLQIDKLCAGEGLYKLHADNAGYCVVKKI